MTVYEQFGWLELRFNNDSVEFRHVEDDVSLTTLDRSEALRLRDMLTEHFEEEGR